MTGSAATVGDNRGSDLHDRLPVRIGHIGNKNFALLKSADILDILYTMRRTLTNFCSYRQALCNDFAGFF